MKLVRKVGTTSPVWPFHPILAAREGFEVFDDGAKQKAESKAAPAPVDVAHEAYSTTDKDQLRAMLADRGVKVAGNPSIKTLQDRLAGVMGADAA
jgi:hypothetical protein